jgi:hypothetical protein
MPPVTVSDIKLSLRPDVLRPSTLALADFTVDAPIRFAEARVVQWGPYHTRLFLPRRPVRRPCPACKTRCEVEDRFCRCCGVPLPEHAGHRERDEHGRALKYEEHAFPVSRRVRADMEQQVISAFLAADRTAESAQSRVALSA